MIGKWLATQPRVLLLDEPTRGIDVGAKQEIYALILGLARRGLAIVLVSSELPGVAAAGRSHPGRIRRMAAGRAERDTASEETIMRLAAPQTRTDAPRSA